MLQGLNNSLQITLIGMGLVFGAIILLWIVMALLVNISEEDKDKKVDKTSDSPPEINSQDKKKLAAAIGVAVALCRQTESMTPHPYPLPPTPIVSAWQAVLRGRMLSRIRYKK